MVAISYDFEMWYTAPLFSFIKRLGNRVSHYYELNETRGRKGKGRGAESWKRESQDNRRVNAPPHKRKPYEESERG